MRRHLIKIIVLALIFTLFSCKKEKYSKQDYIEDYNNYFKIDALSIGLIDSYDLDKEFNQELLISSLIDYITFPQKNSINSIYQKAYELELIDKSKDYGKDDIFILFEKTKQLKDYHKIKEKNNIIFKNNVKSVDKEYILDKKYQEDCLEETILKYYDNSNYQFKKIKNNNGYCVLVDASFDEVIEDIDISGESKIDFTNSEIKEILEFKKVNTKKDGIEEISSKSGKIASIGNFDINYSISSNKISFNILNTHQNGNFYSSIDIYDINTGYKFDLKNKYSYFKLGFKTSETIGFKKEYTQKFFKDFKNEKVDEFLNQMLRKFDLKKEVIEKSIPLLEIKTPISGAPIFTTDLNLSLDIYVGGRIEISFNTKHLLGYEYMNGSLRLINEFDKDFDYLFKASTELTLGIAAGISGIGFKLADIKLNFGIKAQIDNKIYVKKEEDVVAVDSELPSDYLNEVSNNHKDLKLCMEFSAHWVLRLKFNSEGTLLKKFGLTKNIDVFKDDMQVLKNKIYLENFQLVDSCGFEKENKKEELKDINKERITLFTYHKAINILENYQIKFRTIPSGYSLSDFKYSSSDESVATVSSDGNILAKKSGSSVIVIKTKDDKHQISISIIVKSNVSSN